MRGRAYRRDKLKTRKINARRILEGYISPLFMERYPHLGVEAGEVAIQANTGKRCKCCGHRRKFEGMKIQELRQIDSLHKFEGE